MTELIRVVGFDPSLANLGIAIADVDSSTLEVFVKAIKLIETKKSTNKHVRRASDDLERAKKHARAIKMHCDECKIAISEVPHGAQSARGSMSNGVVYGLLASIEIPLIQVQANETKIAAVDDSTATKREMINWASGKYPNLKWIKGRGQLGDKNEHMADAIGVIHAGVQTDQFREALALFRAMKKKAA